MRIARRSADPFLRLLTATATLWVLGQVFINVGYVVGLLPVTGLQLPLISAGGTSTADNASDHRRDRQTRRDHEPEAVAALRAGSRRPGQPAAAAAAARAHTSPTRTEALRDRLRSRPGIAKPSRPQGRRKPDRKPARTRSANPMRPTGRCGAQGIMEVAEIGRSDGLAHWKVSVTGEWTRCR